jgi:uncharacterized protein involved in exopolysaccharide biosynthesis
VGVEVATFLRATLRRWWVVLLVMLLAAGGAFLYTRDTKDTFHGSVVLTVPAVQASTTGSNAQYVENFQTSLTTSDVVKQVAADTKVSTSDLTDGLASSQLNNSSFIEVTYDGSTAAQAKAVVVSAAKRTSAYLARSATQAAQAQRDSAVAAVTAAQKKLTTAQKNMDAFTAKYGLLDPTVALQSAQSQVTQLNVSRLQAIANDRSTKGFDDAIATARKQVATLAPVVRKFNTVSQDLRQAQSGYADAQAKATAAAQALATAESAALIDTPTADRIKARTVIIKAVAIAAGIGLVLGLGLAMLLTAIRRDKPRGRRRRRRAGTTPELPSTAAAAESEPATDRPPTEAPPTGTGTQPHKTAAAPAASGGHRAGPSVDLEKV